MIFVKRIFLTVFVLSFLLFGCSGSPLSSTTSSGSKGKVTGTEGVVFGFLQEPDAVRSDQILNLVVVYSNKGAREIYPGHLRFCLTGYDPSILSFSKRCQITPFLEKKDILFNTDGSVDHFVEWDSRINMPSNVNTGFKQEITINACYKYQTIASPVICIEDDNPTLEKKCGFSVKDLGNSQGAPIVVSKVERELSTNRVLVKIEVTHKGDGVSFNPNVGVSNCENINIAHRNVFNVNQVKIGQTTLRCSPNNPIRFNKGKATIFCEGNLKTSNYVVTPMTISLGYNYKSEIKTSVQINNRIKI